MYIYIYNRRTRMARRCTSRALLLRRLRPLHGYIFIHLYICETSYTFMCIYIYICISTLGMVAKTLFLQTPSKKLNRTEKQKQKAKHMPRTVKYICISPSPLPDRTHCPLLPGGAGFSHSPNCSHLAELVQKAPLNPPRQLTWAARFQSREKNDNF